MVNIGFMLIIVIFINFSHDLKFLSIFTHASSKSLSKASVVYSRSFFSTFKKQNITKFDTIISD
jgi:hypothetical protein